MFFTNRFFITSEFINFLMIEWVKRYLLMARMGIRSYGIYAVLVTISKLVALCATASCSTGPRGALDGGCCSLPPLVARSVTAREAQKRACDGRGGFALST